MNLPGGFGKDINRKASVPKLVGRSRCCINVIGLGLNGIEVMNNGLNLYIIVVFA
jgi:hypothetical protein